MNVRFSDVHYRMNGVRALQKGFEMKSNSRNAGIDMLRILSMFLIVILHVLGQGGAMVRISTHPETYHACWLLETAALCAVNCYGLISGYVGVKASFRPSRLLNLWTIVFFYSVMIIVGARIFWPDYLLQIEVPSNFADLLISNRMYWILKALFPVSMKNYWYFSSYVGVFLLSPYLNRMILSLDAKMQKSLLKVIFLGFSVFTLLPKVLSSDVMTLVGGYSFAWILLLYIAGGCIRCLEWKKRPSWQYILGFLLCTFFAWGWKVVVEEYTRAVIGRAIYGRVFVTYTSPTMVFAAFCLLMLFSSIEIRSEKIVRLIAVISPLAFPVYIIHTHPFIWDAFLFNAFSGYRSYGALQAMGAVLLTALIIFIVCLLIDALRYLLFSALRIPERCRRIDRSENTATGA